MTFIINTRIHIINATPLKKVRWSSFRLAKQKTEEVSNENIQPSYPRRKKPYLHNAQKNVSISKKPAELLAMNDVGLINCLKILSFLILGIGAVVVSQITLAIHQGPFPMLDIDRVQAHLLIAAPFVGDDVAVKSLVPPERCQIKGVLGRYINKLRWSESAARSMCHKAWVTALSSSQ